MNFQKHVDVYDTVFAIRASSGDNSKHLFNTETVHSDIDTIYNMDVFR